MTKGSRMCPRDVYIAANLLIWQHGREAAIFPALNAGSFAEKGDGVRGALDARAARGEGT